MKIKILFLIHDLSVGGAEKVLVNLVNNMDRSKFDITVMSLFGGGVNEQFLKPDIRYYAVFSKTIPGNSKLMKLFTPQQLHRMFIREHYDIEVSYLEGPCARIISGCPDRSTKLVSWIHCMQFTKRAASKSFRSYREADECYGRYDRTICVSDTIRRDFSSLFPYSSPAVVLYNTNETDMILSQMLEPVEQGIFRKNEISLCGVGKITEIKGFDRLARVHKKLRDDGFSVHTFILGVGEEQANIQSYLDENDIADSFSFLGYHTNPYKYIFRCDLFVCSSFSEGFSTAATEALIVGTPVCTVEVSGMKEMLGENNEYGVVCENDENALYEAIKELINDPDRMAHYKKQAEFRGKVFSKERTVGLVEEMLKALVE